MRFSPETWRLICTMAKATGVTPQEYVNASVHAVAQAWILEYGIGSVLRPPHEKREHKAASPPQPAARKGLTHSLGEQLRGALDKKNE